MGKYNLSAVERQFLKKKYVSLGNDNEIANKKITAFCERLKSLRKALKQKDIPEVDINTRFHKEYEKLCQNLDSGVEYIKRLGRKK
jgi:hypothetical protein